MLVQTSRFGSLDVDEQRLITFPSGILGFPQSKVYALVQTGEESLFYWLQAIDRADLAFVVCDPRLFITDYRTPLRAEEMSLLGLDSSDGAQVFVIVNKVDDLLTGNLQGPLVVNVKSRVARQLVLSDKRYSTRHPLMRIPSRVPMGKTA
ncbi:MAG TPA: flagellar assembly protein FliW [Phycisphaerae bacterium]|jgi:flagellar assembly factor FliW